MDFSFCQKNKITVSRVLDNKYWISFATINRFTLNFLTPKKQEIIPFSEEVVKSLHSYTKY